MALILREDDVRRLLTMPDTVDILEQAFVALAGGNAVNHPRTRIVLNNGVMHLLASATQSLGVMGFKTYTAFREGVRYVVMLFSAHDGQLLSIIEADWLGRMRTGGTSGLATRYLARPNATVIGLIGAGKQAVTQLMGVCAVRRVTSVLVYSRNAQKCALFCEEMSRVLRIDVRSVPYVRQAVEFADILISATTSPEPVVHGEWLPQGCHINAVGSNWATRREIDVVTLQRCFLIATDSKEQAHAEAGDFIIPANEGIFSWDSVHELADVVGNIGNKGPRRESQEDITLYKGLGTGLEDVAVAALVYKLAREGGYGQELALVP